jgi:RNA polymerase sigma-70 factor (ECF subfamily)
MSEIVRRGEAMTAHTTRVTLIAKLRNGADAEAWGRFDATYRDMLVRYCRVRGVQAADADDVVQAVFLKLVRGIQNFEYDPAKGRFRSYLYRCAQSAIADRMRAVRSSGAASLDEADRAELPEWEAEWEREWMHHHYRMALVEVTRSIDPQSVTVFEAILSGQAVRAIAEQMEMSEQAVYKVQQRVRTRLKEQIVRQVRDEDSDVG